MQLQEVAPAAPRDLQAYLHGFQEVVRPHCGSDTSPDMLNGEKALPPVSRG
ncbi:unnamed protein product [Prunus armeniaca]